MNIYQNCKSLVQAKNMVKKLGYKIDKVPLFYMESLMSKNLIYNVTPEMEYPEFLMLIFRISIESKFSLEKTIPKMLRVTSQKKSSLWGLIL